MLQVHLSFGGFFKYHLAKKKCWEDEPQWTIVHTAERGLVQLYYIYDFIISTWKQRLKAFILLL